MENIKYVPPFKLTNDGVTCFAIVDHFTKGVYAKEITGSLVDAPLQIVGGNIKGNVIDIVDLSDSDKDVFVTRLHII